MRCFWSLLTSPEGFIFLLIGERQAKLTAFESSHNRSKHAPSPCPSFNRHLGFNNANLRFGIVLSPRAVGFHWHILAHCVIVNRRRM